MESDDPAPVLSEATASGPEPNDRIPEEAAPVAPDPAALVARLIESGEWPDPELFARLVAAGEAALEPLLAFIRTYPKEYEREFVLDNAIDILAMIGSPAAIPELIEVIRRYPEDIGELAAEALGEFGPIAFEPALELVRDPAIVDYPRLHAIQAARHAAGADVEPRARLAEVLRPMLAEAMDRVRARKLRKAVKSPDEDQSEGAAAEDGEGDDLSRGDGAPVKGTGGEPRKEVGPSKYIEGLDEIEAQPVEPDEEVIYLVEHLAAMADPEARELIKTAYAEDLVDPDWVDEKFVNDRYREGGAKPRGRSDRLADYRERYAEHIAYLRRPPIPTRPFHKAGRSSTLEVHAGDPPPMPPQEPIRNTGPKLGRNDPCWCGSGKKYKKCHLGKDDTK